MWCQRGRVQHGETGTSPAEEKSLRVGSWNSLPGHRRKSTKPSCRELLAVSGAKNKSTDETARVAGQIRPGARRCAKPRNHPRETGKYSINTRWKRTTLIDLTKRKGVSMQRGQPNSRSPASSTCRRVVGMPMWCLSQRCSPTRLSTGSFRSP